MNLGKKACMALWVGQGVLLLAPALLSASSASQQDSAAALEASPAAAPEQPLPFSHKTHFSFQLSCKFCHTNPEPGNLMTLPAGETCMGCHAAVATDKPAIQKLAAFAKSGEPIPWKRVYSVPGFVYWNHRTHLEGGLTCEMCHGNVAQMDVMSRTTNVTTMAGCVGCHRKKEAPSGCETCHESHSSLLTKPSVPEPVDRTANPTVTRESRSVFTNLSARLVFRPRV